MVPMGTCLSRDPLVVCFMARLRMFHQRKTLDPSVLSIQEISNGRTHGLNGPRKNLSIYWLQSQLTWIGVRWEAGSIHGTGIWVFPKIVVVFPPNHPLKNRLFHDFHHPWLNFWLVLPQDLEGPSLFARLCWCQCSPLKRWSYVVITSYGWKTGEAPWLFLEFVGDEMLPKYYGDCNKPLKRSLLDNQYIRFWGSKEYCPDIMGIIRNHYVQARSFSSWVAQTSKDWDYTTQLYEDDNKPL